MAEQIVVVCRGPKAKPHKPFKFPFDRDGSSWTSLTHEVFGDPDGGARAIDSALHAGVHPKRFEGHHVRVDADGQRQSRVRGGVRMTRRGWELICARHTRVGEGIFTFRAVTLSLVLDQLAANGIAEIDAHELLDLVRRVAHRK
ncbi:hypothetical protein JOF53_007067 [Crossiella equi]|uniref:Uncharacterized protein n=1 Tax=Crossiella equi TaxID=130796 RepID=A0ABS5AR65_9PSEU|nr:hypothetical protein [Crossiella equi]MBP2478195.1 hypothetical protein [Crossiella equi]